VLEKFFKVKVLVFSLFFERCFWFCMVFLALMIGVLA